MEQHILTKRPDDRIARPYLLPSYSGAIKAFLSNTNEYVHVSADELDHFVRSVSRATLQRPKLDCVVHSSPGNAERKTVDLIEHLNSLNDKIISPFGVAYMDVTKKRSFLKDFIDASKSRRKKSKKAMLSARAAGNHEVAEYYNADQSLQKINMNSMPGGMGSAYNFLSDVSGFNSITSTGRYAIMSAYANAERFLEGNFYFPTVEHVMDYINLIVRICPEGNRVSTIAKRFGLFIPNHMDVTEFFVSQYQKYNAKILPRWIGTWISNCTEDQLIFLYYAHNFKNLIQVNEDIWTPWIKRFFHYDDSMFDPDIDIASIFKLESDLVIIMSTVYTDWLPVVNGKKTSIYDTVKEYPEIAKKLASVGKHMTGMVENMNEVFDVFMKTHTSVGKVLEHRNMIRETVIASDTDSVIFTTAHWLSWFQKSTRVTPEAFQINAFVVYWLSRSTEYLLNTISRHRGALGADVFDLTMKNEFLYVTLTLSNLKKHYAGMVMVQEGNVMPTSMSDIKGVHFRGSSLNGFTLKFIKDFIDSTHEEIAAKGTVSATDLIAKVLGFEKTIYDSLINGETKFLPIKPINEKSAYANSDSGLYFNYMFWKDVFAPMYGDMLLPTKCFIVPLKNILEGSYLFYLERHNSALRDRLTKFVEKYPDKPIIRVPINPLMDRIPEELIRVMNIKSIVIANANPLYLFLRSLNISTGVTNKSPITFTDIYAPTLLPMISAGGSKHAVEENEDGDTVVATA